LIETIPNTRPTANAGPDQVVQESITNISASFVKLNGTASSDPDGCTLSFSWKQIGGTDQVTPVHQLHHLVYSDFFQLLMPQTIAQMRY
jgi:hypothetical protein